MPTFSQGTNTQGQGIGSIVPSSNAVFDSTGGIQTAPTSTINSSTIAPSTPITLPPVPTVNTGTAANASIPSPIPSSSSIINQDTTTTPTDTQQTSLLNQIAQLTGNQQSQATDTTNSENNSADYQNALKTTNGLATQLQGLADQSTALQNAAAPGGSLQNQEQLGATGRGITAGGLQALSSADLRNNQIQQASVASQSLTLKSAYYAANNNLTLAKAAADQAAQVQFDASTQQINGLKAQLAAIQPTLDKEQQKQAAQLSADLTDRSNQIAQQKTDFTNGIALINGATTANGQDPQAQLAIAQARAIDPSDPQYLQKVSALLTPYQKDPVAAATAIADLQLKQAQLKQLNGSNQGIDLTQFTPQQQQALQSGGFTSFNSETQGLAEQLVTGNIAPGDLSKRATGTSPYNSILSAANAYSKATTGQPFNISQAQRDYQFATNVGTQNTLNYLTSLVGTSDGTGGTSGGNLDQLISMSNARTDTTHIGSAGQTVQGSQGLPALNNVSQWAKIQAGDPQMAAYYATITEVSDQIAKVLQGGGTGSGTSDAKLAQAQALFQKGFTPDQISAVAGSLKGLLTNRAKGIIGTNPYLSDYASKLGIDNTQQSATQTVVPTAQVPDGYYQASDGLFYKK